MFHPINVWLLSSKEQEIHEKEQEEIMQNEDNKLIDEIIDHNDTSLADLL